MTLSRAPWRPIVAFGIYLSPVVLAQDSPPAAVPAAPPSAVTPAETQASPLVPAGDEVLREALHLLALGEYERALQIAVPGMTTYPELLPSFRAVVEVAADQLERRRLDAAVAADAPRVRSRRSRRPDVMDWGFDLGFPTGLRLEWTRAGRAFDSMGVRIGGNFIAYDGVTMVTDASFFFDVTVNGPWQLEGTLGFIGYYGWLYPQAGAALQYDPPSPMHVNVGARVGPDGSVLPDVSVGFTW